MNTARGGVAPSQVAQVAEQAGRVADGFQVGGAWLPPE